MFKVPERYRITSGELASTHLDKNNGLFMVPINRNRTTGPRLAVIASDGEGWEHVSVSHHTRCPRWEEMCAVKALFWGPEDWVMQYHPAESQYVNCHPRCLHLWRPTDQHIPIPPTWLVGPKATDQSV